MQKRVEDVEQTTKLLPATTETKNAIKDGVDAVAKAAIDAITTNAANKPLNRYR